MAIEILSLDEIDELFADLVQSVLELRADQVLISYPIKGQKSPKYNDTVVFVHTSQEQDNIQIYKNRKSEYNPVLFKYNTIQSSMRSLSVSFHSMVKIVIGWQQNLKRDYILTVLSNF